LLAEWDLNDDFSLKSITAYSKLFRRSGSDYDGSPYTVVEPNTSNKFDFWSQEVNVSGRLFDDRLDWLTGVFYSDYEVSDGANPTLNGNVVLPVLTSGFKGFADHRETVKSLGVFGHLIFHVTDEFSITGGVRWSRDATHFYSSDRILAPTGGVFACDTAALGGTPPGCSVDAGGRKFSGWSYNFAADYKITQDVMVYAATRRGYRAGGWNFGGTIRSFLPETATDYEIGFKSEWLDRRLQFNIAAYRTNYQQIQRTVAVILPSGQTGLSTDNAARAVIKGVEAEVRVKPSDALDFGGTYTYTDPKYKKFQQEVAPGVFQDLSNTAWEVSDNVFSLYAQYRANLPSNSSVIFRADWLWQSDMIFAANANLPVTENFYKQNAYGLLNGRITFNIESADLRFAFFGKNLLGKKYHAAAVYFEDSLGYGIKIPGEPRVLGLEITKNF
jgi:iron complex outermembrane receptor protein